MISKNGGAGYLAIAGAVTSLILITHFATAANAAEPTSSVSQTVIEEAQGAIETCHQDSISAALEVTASAAKGTGETLDAVQVACTQTGVTFSGIVDGLAENFGGLFGSDSESVISDPAVLEHVAYGDLDAAAMERLATLTVEEQTIYLNGLDAMGGEQR